MSGFKLKNLMIKKICLLLSLSLLLAGCGKTSREPLAADNLAGRKVGTVIGESTDYILSSPAYGLDVFRYDTYADMQLALRFNRIDAASMESDEAYVFCRMQPDTEIGLIAAEQMEFGYVFNADRQELLEQFNQFIKEFRKTEEYADLLRRVEASAEAPYQAKKVENTAPVGKALRVAAFDGWEPVSYINTSTGEWEGCDVELTTHFANSIGAKLELKAMSWGQMMIEMGSGLVDLMLYPASLMMAKDMEMSGNITMSDWVFLKDIVLVVNKEEQ